MRQPLAGEVAARRELLERLPFATGYGVEIAMLIDVWRKLGLEGIAQVDLDEHRNRHQPLSALAPMAPRCSPRSPAAWSRRGGWPDVDGGPVERPPLAGVTRVSARACAACTWTSTARCSARARRCCTTARATVTIDGVRAVQACLRAGVEVVLMSGRRRAQVFEDARLLGQSSFIFEAGACVVLDGEEHWLTGDR